MRQLLLLFSCSMILPVAAETLPVVSDSNCVQQGNTLRKCESASQVAQLDRSLPEYIPLHTKVSVGITGNCSTSYPLQIDMLGDGTQLMGSIDVFREREIEIDNSEYADFDSVTFLTNSPYSNVAYYDGSCRIITALQFNTVDINGLTQNLRSLKLQKEQELRLVTDLIVQQKLIIDLAGAVSVYESVINIADLDRVSLQEVSTILMGSCADSSQCTWSDQILVILQNSPDLAISHKYLLFTLGQKLDTLVPSACEDENCVSSLIDTETRIILDEIIEKTPVLNEAREALDGYLKQKIILDLLLDDYKQACGKYGINWEEL